MAERFCLENAPTRSPLLYITTHSGPLKFTCKLIDVKLSRGKLLFFFGFDFGSTVSNMLTVQTYGLISYMAVLTPLGRIQIFEI